jgi:cellobiose-specific phosphotransferase system component IIB
MVIQAGYNVHHKYYFGKMNALRLVNAAKDWVMVGPQVSFTTPAHKVELSVGANPVRSELVITAAEAKIERLEHVQITVSLTAAKRGSLEIILLCPSGTSSTILSRRPNDSANGDMNWTFMTTRCWDERFGVCCIDLFGSCMRPVRSARGFCSSRWRAT